MNRRLFLITLALSLIATTARENDAYDPWNIYSWDGGGNCRYYGYGNGPYGNGYGANMSAAYNRAKRGSNMDMLGQNLDDAEPAQNIQPVVQSPRPLGSLKLTSETFAPLASGARFRQVWLQYLQHEAFNRPEVYQQLKLTTAQRQAFRQYDQDWKQYIAKLSAEPNSASTSLNKDFDQLLKSVQKNVTATLTDQQREQWQRLVGDQFDFSLDFYVESAPSSTTTGNPISP